MPLTLMVACGGGGGGSGSSSTPPSNQPPINQPPSTAKWSDPLTVSSASGGADKVQVAIDNSGNALAIWLQLNSSGVYAKSLWSSRYSASSGWSNPQLIENSNADISEFTLVMRRDSGRAVVLWNQLTSANYDIWARTFDPASGWEAVASVESIAGAVTETSAAIDANGNVAAVWSQNTNSRFHVYSNRHVPGVGWGTPVLIETHDISGDQDTGARIAMLPSGDALAVWIRSTGTSSSIWTNHYTVNTGWGAEQELVPDLGTNFSLGAPSIASDASNGALLAWGQWQLVSGAQQSTIVVKRYAAGWQSANIEVATPVASSTISTPFIAANDSGTYALVWQRGDISLQSSIASTGGVWSSAVALRPAGSRSLAGMPAIALDAAGNAFAAWASSQNVEGEADVQINRYGPANSWGTAQTLHALQINPATASASNVALSMNAGGDAVVAYLEYTSANGSRVVVRNYRAP